MGSFDMAYQLVRMWVRSHSIVQRLDRHVFLESSVQNQYRKSMWQYFRNGAHENNAHVHAWVRVNFHNQL